MKCTETKKLITEREHKLNRTNYSCEHREQTKTEQKDKLYHTECWTKQNCV